MFTIGAFGVILNEERKVLLCHRTDMDLWNLPGGRVEENESPWEAVIREIREETGLNARIIKLTGIYTKENSNDIVFNFLCEKTGGELTLNDEADEIGYFSIDEIPVNTIPRQYERIKHVFNRKIFPVMMKQNGIPSKEYLKSLQRNK